MSYFNDTNLGVLAEVFTSYTPDNGQSYYLPSTVQENATNYQHPNYFGQFDQAYAPENSHQYFTNGYQPTDNENQGILYPVVNQVYVPESHLYNVVHAVVYHGTTYFYQSVIDFPVYKLSSTVTYTPGYIDDENSVYTNCPGENNHTNSVEEYIETTSEDDYQSNALELFSTQSNMSPSPYMSTFNSPEMDLNSCSYNSYWNSTFIQSECDIVENYHENTSSAIVEDNVTLCTEVFENCYTEDIVTPNESNIYYEGVNYGWPHLRDDLSLGEGSILEPMQAPLALETLDKNTIKAQVKFKKDNIYLTALSGKLYQKQSIPVVEKLPVITEVEDDCPMIECSNKTIDNLSQNKAVVKGNRCTTYSKKVCRRKSIRVVESLTDCEKSNHEDHVIDRSIGFFSKTMQRIDSAARENTFANQCTKTYRKESCLFVENVHLVKEVTDKCKVRESSQGKLAIMERSYSVLEEKMFTKRTEKLVRKERKQDFREMPVIQETGDEDQVVQSSNLNIPKIRQCVVHTNTFTGRSINLYKKERSHVFEKMPIIEEDDDEGHLPQHSNENVIKIKKSVAHTNTFTGRSINLYKKERSHVFEKMPIIEEDDDEGHLPQHSNENVIKIKKSVAHKTGRNVISNKGHLRSFQIEEPNPNTDKDHDGFLENNGNMEENLLTQENGFQNKTSDIPQAENRNTDNLLASVNVANSSVINEERHSLDRCQEMQNNDNIFQTTEINAPVENTEGNISLIPLCEDVGVKETLETTTTLEKKNEPTKVHCQKPKKKRFENLRKFLGRLLSCCSKGPT